MVMLEGLQIIKSYLQESLEDEGYRFFTNISLFSGYEIEAERDSEGYFNYQNFSYKKRAMPFTDSELVEKVKDFGKYSEIRIEEAFDIFGRLLPDYKAVYVKDGKPLKSTL